MLKLSKLLTDLLCAVCLITPSISFGFDFEGKPDNLQTNGFVYFTEFSDHEWFNGRQVAALNIDYDIDNFAIRTQLSSYKEQPIRRAVLEFSQPLPYNLEFTAQVGRFSVAESVFDDTTSSPGAFRMAMLPNAGYSYRMFNGAFTIMDGWQVATSWRASDFLVKVRYGSGKSVIPSQIDLIHESFKRDFEGDDAIEMTATPKSYILGMQVEAKDFVGYMSRNQYAYEVHKIGNSYLANLADTRYSEITYRVDRIGGKYDNGDFWIHQEWFHDYTHAFDKRANKMYWYDTGNSIGDVTIVGVHFTDAWSSYIGKSHGKNKMGTTHNIDQFVGVTWNSYPFTVSVEQHRGEGFAWRKHDAPYVDFATKGYPQWDSLVVSGTYVF